MKIKTFENFLNEKNKTDIKKGDKVKETKKGSLGFKGKVGEVISVKDSGATTYFNVKFGDETQEYHDDEIKKV